MGSVKSIEMDNEVHLIWEFISTQNNWLTEIHIPGVFNEDADRESRKQELRTEWMLNQRDFRYVNYVTKKLNVSPSIDLFASRLITQLPEFISYRPDPESKTVNDFTQSWTELKFYAFPPFICLPRVIQKIWQEGILVVPDWPNQLWYSQFCNMITKDVPVPPRQELLLSPTDPNISHPLHQTLQLRTATVSGML